MTVKQECGLCRVTIETSNWPPTGLRLLNVVVEFTRECLGAFVARNIGARDVRRWLEDCFRSRGAKPKILCADNGREFTADSLLARLRSEGIESAAVEKGPPQQNCFVNGSTGPCATSC